MGLLGILFDEFGAIRLFSKSFPTDGRRYPRIVYRDGWTNLKTLSSSNAQEIPEKHLEISWKYSPVNPTLFPSLLFSVNFFSFSSFTFAHLGEKKLFACIGQRRIFIVKFSEEQKYRFLNGTKIFRFVLTLFYLAHL